jgi:hypothetical protein
MQERVYPGTLRWDRQMVQRWYPRIFTATIIFFFLLFAFLAYCERQMIDKRETDRKLGNQTEEGR